MISRDRIETLRSLWPQIFCDEVTGDEIDELCRVYLAWLDAPEAWMSYNIEEYMCAHGNDAAEQERIDDVDGKRVRLVEVK